MAHLLSKTSQTFPRKQLWLVILPASLFILALIARTLPGTRTIDDAYITYRYARNILAGNGFVYNPGEHVLGTTTPLYTFILTLIAYLAGGIEADFPSIAMIVNAVADGFTCILLFLLGKKLNAPIAGFGAGLAWAIAPYSVTFAIGGLETSVFVLLMVGLTYVYISHHYASAALLAALAILTRPDAVLLVIPIIVDRCIDYLKIINRSTNSKLDQPKTSPSQLLNEFPQISKEITVFVVPLVLWTIFSTAYFGNPLPHSIIAKSLAYRLPADAGFIRMIQHYATLFMDHLTFGIPAIGVGMILYPVSYCIGALYAFRATRNIWPFLIYPWVYFVVYSVANPLIFRWYLTPPLTALFLISLTGAENIVRKIASHFRNIIIHQDAHKINRTSDHLVILIVVIIPFALLLRGWALHPDHGLKHPAPQMAWYQLEILYQQAANELNENISEKNKPVVLAAGDVGVLGYLTNAIILDTVGLNSPISTQYYPTDPAYYVTNYAIPPGLILNVQPDYLVILEVYGREGLLNDERFRSLYTLRTKIPTDIYGSDGMLIFEKLKR